MIAYDTPQSDTQRRRIQSYLAIKYGITLDQTISDFLERHYYNSAGDIIWNARSNQGFAQNIAGIGLDAGSCLTQIQSRSQNPEGILRIGRASDHDDGEFLVWGNNGQAITTYGSTDAPNGFIALNRIWRAQETGEVGNLEIAFPNGALGKSNGADYFLLVDTNNDGSFIGETPQPFSFNGEEFIIKKTNLNDGNRFTIAVECSQQAVVELSVREEYYLPVPEDQVLEVLQTLYPSSSVCNRSTVTREPRAPVFNYTSITTQGDGTIIVYDHWEDGFEEDLENPQQATTEIWGDGNLDNGYPPGFPCDVIVADAIVLNEAIDPDDRGSNFYYDGGDRLGASGPISITKANWAEGGRTLFAGAVEVFATDFWNKEYLIPFGENVITSTQSL
jgi:hypothetical protein